MYKQKSKGSSKKKSKPRRQVAMMPSMGLPACTLKYANALANPFSASAFGACIPVGNFRPSMKNHTRHFTSTTIGAGGFGYFMYSPCLANNATCLWTTSASYVGTASSPGNTSSVGVVLGQMSTLPFLRTQLVESDVTGARASVLGRIVSAGIKWRYTGTELNRGGTIVAYSDPLHESVEGLSYNQLSGYAEAAMTAPNANHTADYLTVFASNFRELNYPDTTPDSSATVDTLSCIYPYSDQLGTVTDASTGAPVCVVVFQGEVGNTYQIEVIVHSEYEGTLAQGMLTPNNSDEQGTSRVQAAASRATTAGATGNGGFSSRFWDGYRNLVRESKPVLLDIYRAAKAGTRAYAAWERSKRGSMAMIRDL